MWVTLGGEKTLSSFPTIKLVSFQPGITRKNGAKNYALEKNKESKNSGGKSVRFDCLKTLNSNRLSIRFYLLGGDLISPCRIEVHGRRLENELQS